VWTFVGGDPPSSRAIAPSVQYARPGVYTVMLAAGGPAGTTTTTGTVTVTAGGVGAACGSDSDCDGTADLTCLCPPGSGCPGGLAAGLCTRACDGRLCRANELCVDLSRGASFQPPEDGGVGDGAVHNDPWRRALCLPACTLTSECRVGLACLDVPALDPGAPEGGTFAWRRACFAEVLDQTGGACFGPAGEPDPSRCLSGRCDPLGARGLCTADCGDSACPSVAACASFNASPASHLCLVRCDAAHPCTDPLLACEPAGGTGALGFAVAPGELDGATYCAPRRCTQPSDCAPAGTCAVMGAASFCTR
jgi:PKD repeat protein